MLLVIIAAARLAVSASHEIPKWAVDLSRIPQLNYTGAKHYCESTCCGCDTCIIATNRSDIMKSIGYRNCYKVKEANRTFMEFSQRLWTPTKQLESWEKRREIANLLCDLFIESAHSKEDNKEVAYLAVAAWSDVMMQGKECCTLSTAPYCNDTQLSLSTWGLLAAGVLFGILFLMAWLASMTRPGLHREAALKVLADEARFFVDDKPAPGYMEPQNLGNELSKELEAAWMHGSSLRVLPRAAEFARMTAVMFGALFERFDFQPDSVRAQHRHLLTLLRSMCSVVADRDLEDAKPVDESRLLKEAIENLWTELLEGYRLWKAKVNRECPDDAVGSDTEDDCDPSGDLPPLAGAPYQSPGDTVIQKQLVEVIAFLLVWGEAGNVRFMPEVVHFITDQVFFSEDRGSCSALYGGAPRSLNKPGQPYRSGLFLSKVIRPIYNNVFDEWYGEMGAKKPSLHPGYENFLPADVSNYDDWDELFLDPPRMTSMLVLRQGTPLYELGAGERFANLHDMDWGKSLNSAKTHREVHSLWGVFAATHRIVLLHMVLFFTGVVLMAEKPPAPMNSDVPIGGFSLVIRLAAVGLLVPFHGLMWSFAKHETTGVAFRQKRPRVKRAVGFVVRSVLFAAPIFTYGTVRLLDAMGWSRHTHDASRTARYEETSWELMLHSPNLSGAIVLHYVISLAGLVFLLFFSVRDGDVLFPPTHVPLRLRVIRNIFWFCVMFLKFTMALFIFREIFKAFDQLHIALPGQESIGLFLSSSTSNSGSAHLILWLLVWCTCLLLFIGDTQMWFVLGCAILGSLSYFVQRRCQVVEFATEDAIALVPQRFTQKVLTYAQAGVERHASDSSDNETDIEDDGKKLARFSQHFPAIWDRAMEFMRYEDKIDNAQMGDMVFHPDKAGRPIPWSALRDPIHRARKNNRAPFFTFDASLPSSPDNTVMNEVYTKGMKTVDMPELFRAKTFCESLFQDLNSNQFGPSNVEVQWRLKALSRGLGLPMPRPYRAPYIPQLTVLIPHYGEDILMEKKQVYDPSANVPLIDWVKTKYEDEFRAFCTRMQSAHDWPVSGSHWNDYTDEQWVKLCSWTSMRMQTLWRTVAGMFLYLPAIQAHYEVQGDMASALAQPGVWQPDDCFCLMVSMQMYHFFNKTQYQHTNQMFEKFPKCLHVAYIAWEDRNENGEKDRLHPKLKSRNFSNLINKDCPLLDDGLRRKAIYSVELPGFPILGDGKGDNQNHAIIFLQGLFNQCIDANQGAYFEQMMLLPNALGEFRSRFRGDPNTKHIIGFPEHITSDIGSIGDFAASAELAFGTMLQRTYNVLGARMHYGHPDIMNKLYMIQQGGVSKATKTLNLSEDIFAGMDFTLRGNNRSILHCEYFHLAKGRDLGFNTVLGFFSKLSSGAGEQILTRQMFRLHQILGLPEALTFWYAHVGYYMTQFFVSQAMPMLVFTWLILLLTDCNDRFSAFESCSSHLAAGDTKRAAEVMANMLSFWFSYLIFFFLVITNLPLFLEVWMEQRFIIALVRFVKQMITLSPLLFVFQAKSIGSYVMNELRYGGATYVNTGRGLPTERRCFIGTLCDEGMALEKVGGLYLDYARVAFYDGFHLLFTTCLVLAVGGVYNAGKAGWSLGYLFFSIGLTITSWLLGPFIFNPYQFDFAEYRKDLRAWIAFFLHGGGKYWIDWYNANHLKPRDGFRTSIIDIGFFFVVCVLLVWGAAVNMKLHVFYAIFDESSNMFLKFVWALMPPIGLSALFCLLVAPLEMVVGCFTDRTKGARRRMKTVVNTMFGQSSEESEEVDEDVEEDAVCTIASKDGKGNERRDVVVQAVEQDKNVCGCSRGTPMMLISFICVSLDLLEATGSFYEILKVGWVNAVVAGIMFKLSVLSMVLWIAEGLMKSKTFGKCESLLKPLQLFVYAHRIARDFVVSGFILLVLSVLVCLNVINDCCMPGCSIHQLLIYRDPGHLKRSEAFTLDIENDSASPLRSRSKMS
jgi:hypothetical protein